MSKNWKTETHKERYEREKREVSKDYADDGQKLYELLTGSGHSDDVDARGDLQMFYAPADRKLLIRAIEKILKSGITVEEGRNRRIAAAAGNVNDARIVIEEFEDWLGVDDEEQDRLFAEDELKFYDEMVRRGITPLMEDAPPKAVAAWKEYAAAKPRKDPLIITDVIDCYKDRGLVFELD